MKKPTRLQLSPLALVPCLMSVAMPAAAVVTCAPTATPSTVRPGGTVTLRGNCIDSDNNNQPVATGTEVWVSRVNGSNDPAGSRTLPDGELIVTAPGIPGEITYSLPRIDGYGGGIDLAGDGDGPSVVVTVAADAADTQATIDQLTSALTTLQTSRVRSNLQQAETRLRHLRASETPGAPKQRFGVYATGLGDVLRQDASATQSEFKARTTAVSVGADYRLSDEWVLGGNVGASKSHVSFAGSASDQKSKGAQATAYASWSVTASTYVSATLSYEASKFDLRRDDGAGQVSVSSPRGHGLGLSLSGGQDFSFGPWSVGPYVRWDRVTSDIDAFDESGSLSAVSVGAQRARSDSFNVGAQTQLSVPVSWGLLLPFVRAEVSHRRDATRQAATATLLSDNTTLLVPTAADTRGTSGSVAFGVSGLQQGGISWFADFDTGVAQKGYRTQRFNLGLRFEL